MLQKTKKALNFGLKFWLSETTFSQVKTLAPYFFRQHLQPYPKHIFLNAPEMKWSLITIF